MRVAVAGAGISGLAGALRLRELGIDVSVFDRAPRAGGCIQTMSESGFTLELGPDSLLVEKPAARDLLARLNLERDVVAIRPEFRGARIVHRGRLRPIPSGFRLFTPASIPALVTSGIFSAAGIARAAMEPFVPARRSADDESLASFVTRRFGREVLDRLAQPLVGGIYSGDPQRLSMQATLPQFVEMERKHGSLVRAMTATKHSNALAPVQLMSLRGGLQTIADAIAQRLGPAVSVSSEIVSLSRAGSGWAIGFADGSQTQADALICALPAYATAKLLREVDPVLSELLERIRYNSIATVNLAYDAADVPPLPPMSGFVVPFIEGRRITAATVTSQKYPDRSPQDGMLLRAFIGGALQPELVELPDAQLAQITRDEFAALLGITAEPRFALVRRWIRLLPEYGVGHAQLISSIEGRVSNLTGLALAGSAFRGVGIPDCVASGIEAAERLVHNGNPAKSG